MHDDQANPAKIPFRNIIQGRRKFPLHEHMTAYIFHKRNRQKKHQ